MINSVTAIATIIGILILFVIAVVVLIFCWAAIKILLDMRYDEQQARKYRNNDEII